MIAVGHWRRGVRGRPGAAVAIPDSGATVGALSATLVVVLGLNAGGYYPSAWGWATVGVLSVGAAALAAGSRIALGRRDWLTLAALFAWLCIGALGAARPGAATAGVPELERGTLYLAVLWTALLVIRRETIRWCAGGLFAGIVAISVVGLVDVLLPHGASPDQFEGRLVYQPVGYANAMGILAALGILLALALTHRAAAAALVPLVVTLALTGSRGALGALVVGLAILVAFGHDLRRLCSALALPVVAAIAALLSSVDDSHASAGVVARDGRVVGLVVVVLTMANATLPQRATSRSRRDLVLAACALALVGAAGSQFALADRVHFWHAAWIDIQAHPLLGSGPGSFAAVWLRYRDVQQATRDAHSLYLQTLAEIGPFGLATLLVALVLPLTVFRRAAERHPLAPGLIAAYAAFLVHAGVDWDWQMPAVTATAVVLAALVLVAARDETQRSGVPVSLAAAVTGLVIVASFAGIVGNGALAAAQKAVASGDWQRAETLSSRAERWQPWSSDPLLVAGRAKAGLGDRRAARATFLQATRRAPGDWLAWYDLAVASTGPARAQALGRAAALTGQRAP